MARKLIPRLVFLSLILLGVLTRVARPEQLPVKKYTIADGLARDYINRINVYSHGFI